VGQYCNVNFKYLVMAFLATDKDGSEYLHHDEPWREYPVWVPSEHCVPLPKGSIERLIGRALSWEDEPVELTEQTLTPKTP